MIRDGHPPSALCADMSITLLDLLPALVHRDFPPRRPETEAISRANQTLAGSSAGDRADRNSANCSRRLVPNSHVDDRAVRRPPRLRRF